MTFDRSKRELLGRTYTYVDDPRVETVTSGPNTQVTVPKGVPAGGITITVTGENLQYIQEPRMAVQYDGNEYRSVSNDHAVFVIFFLSSLYFYSFFYCHSP